MHFLGLKWDNLSGIPYVQFAQSFNSQSVESFEFKVGSCINISFQDKNKYCIGYFKYPNYERISCGRTVHQGVQCDDCWQKNAGIFLPLNTLKDSQKELLKNQNHFNYLNLFGSTLVKTGVAAAIRKYSRILEQGAHSSLFFTECDGVVAREIEHWISGSFKEIKERVTVSTKANLAYEYPTREEAQDVLVTMYNGIVEKIPKNYSKYLREPEFLYNIEKYHLEDKRSFAYFIKNLSSVENISGKIVGVVGETIILEDSRGRQLFLNTKMLLGRLIDINTEQSKIFMPENNLKPITFQINKQVSLF